MQLPITLLASFIGVWLFYVQHQFEDAYWEHDPVWTSHEADLHGRSHYVLPAVLRWFSANIGGHHVHRLGSRITLWQSVASVRLALWDERQRRLISSREARAQGQEADAPPRDPEPRG